MPRRVVSLTRPFQISRTEVTVGQFEAFAKATGRSMPACPGEPPSSASMPVQCVSFSDAWDYVAWLSRTTKRTYRLPSASEWEYAARAGSDTLDPAAANVGAKAPGPKAAGSQIGRAHV